MDLSELKQFKLIYVASPYSKYPYGLHAAFVDVCKVMGDLLKAGLRNIYSPIAHTHPIAKYNADLDPLDHGIWLALDEAVISRCDAMLIARLHGWQDSFGIQHEIALFDANGFPIFHYDPVKKVLI